MPLLGYSYRFYISLAFTLLVLILGSVFSTLFYYQSKEIITDLTSKAFGFTVEDTAYKTTHLFESAESLVDVVASHDITNVLNAQDRRPHFKFLLNSFAKSNNISSIYIAYDDGDFYLVRRLPSKSKRTSFHDAPENTRYVIQISEKDNGKTMGEYRYYDNKLNFISVKSEHRYGLFDPRTRHWYQDAMSQNQAITADPYVFFTTKEIGTTIAQKSSSTRAVIAADISLTQLSDFLVDFKTTENAKVALLTRGNGVIASVDNTISTHLTNLTPNTAIRLPLLKDEVLEDALMSSQSKQTKNSLYQLTSNHKNWFSMVRNIRLPNNSQYTLVIAIPTNELLSDATLVLIKSISWMVGLLAFVLVFTNKLASKLAKPIYALVQKTDQIRTFNFNKDFNHKSSVKEVNLLSDAMNKMNATIRHFMEMNKLLAEEEDFSNLQEALLGKILQICDAKAGALYLIEDQDIEEALVPQIITIGQQQIRDHKLVPLKRNNLPDAIQQAINEQSIIQLTQNKDAHRHFTFTTGIDSLSGKLDTSWQNLVIVPLFNRKTNLVGCLILLMDHSLDEHHQAFIKAISRKAALSIETRQLIQSQDALFDSFIMLLASAIDGKSSYTAEHCKRVPEIMKLLAKAADVSRHGPYADFKLTKNTQQAIHVAAWLHDCGKITTPEYVIDKATKLETIYDRIHEIRMRFELVKKDVELDMYKRQLAGEDPQQLAYEFDKEIRIIDEEFLLIAACNQGDTVMDNWTCEQIEKISKRKWTRTLSDRVGVSQVELARKLRSGTTPKLPTEEYLLADKEEHKILRENNKEHEQHKKLGFNLKQPELMYNRGEIYSLLVKKGTLNEEERYKINEHIVQSSLMMEQLCFPKHLKNVPEIACGHHEKMDGTGYPKGLTSEQMSPLAKMMAIADIFEALTSDDRPYKKPNTLSQSLSIMSKMRDKQHIDSELFDLFVENGVYKEYAVKYLDEKQIDSIQPEEFLSEKGKLHYFNATSRFTN
ncbi:chemotaxis sensory transducer family protein [Marinomonas sp. MED121]|uniref:HD domain-containing phosphohydrolase n=1 Tax=Marinomonas sp. MED121 TaxID=314277 RepID=UPI000068FA36|nr:HD domain-containing phosphohydrolase [Marinomonas sp. MED121]EAQ64116.1 chemotaxis sensory transducer family protein [Marinomonas sp. MED121]